MTDSDDSTIGVVRKTTRELARKFDYEYWRAKDRLGEYPWEFVTAFAEGGWLGALIPEVYGGLGLGITESGAMMQEIAASGAGASGASAVHFYLFPPAPIIRHGSARMKQEFLPRLARGEILMAFGVTEPTAGVDTSRIRTKADRIDGGWIVNGQKVWISNAQNAHKILLLARTSPRDQHNPLDGMTLFFTDLDRDRITVREIEKLGRSAVDSNELFIENLEVPDEDIVGEVGRGFNHLVDGLNSERIVVGMEGVGIGRAALDSRPSTPTNAWSSTGRSERTRRSRIRSRTHGSASSRLAWWRCTRPRSSTTTAIAGQRPTPPNTSAPRPASTPATARCRPLAAMPTRRSTTWSGCGGGAAASNAPVSQEMVLNYISAQALKMPRSY